jgi:hypothetical protein
MSQVGKAQTQLRDKMALFSAETDHHLGGRSSYYRVLNETGELMLDQKIATTAKALQAA